MKISLTSLLMTLAVTTARAQDVTSFKPYQLSVEFFKTDGRPFVNSAYDVEGSPFLTDDWKDGDVVLSGNRQISHVKMRLNCQTQEMHFLDKSNQEMALPAGLIKEARFKQPGREQGNDSVITVFRTGMPAVDQQTAASFYQVLSEGKVQLLCARRKAISTTTNPSSGEVRKEFVTYESYYLFDGKEMKWVKKDRAFIESALADKGRLVADFMTKNKLKAKSFEEIKKIVDYYNTLP